MTPESCCYCQTETENLRPYGPDGKPVCCLCSRSAPERAQEAERQAQRVVDAAFMRSSSKGVVLSPNREPYPVEEAGPNVRLIVFMKVDGWTTYMEAPEPRPVMVAGGPVGEA